MIHTLIFIELNYPFTALGSLTFHRFVFVLVLKLLYTGYIIITLSTNGNYFRENGLANFNTDLNYPFTI